MANKAGKKAPKDTGRAKDNLEIVETGSMDFWRTVAKQVAPKTTDEWEISELATILEESAKYLGASYPGISKVCSKAVDEKCPVSVSIVLDRTESPPEISVKVSFSEKHSVSSRVRVADPAQTELPLAAGDKSGEGDGENDLPGTE